MNAVSRDSRTVPMSAQIVMQIRLCVLIAILPSVPYSGQALSLTAR